MRSSACDTLIRFCARHVLCWPAFPLVPALRSPGSAATFPADASAVDFFALFAGFTATMAGPTSRVRASSATAPHLPDADRRTRHTARDDGGQTRDLPGSDTILLHVMWPYTPAGRQHLAWRCRTCCLRAKESPRPLRLLRFRCSILH